MRGLLAGPDGDHVEHRPLALVGGVVLHRHPAGDLHPVPVLVLAQVHALGDEAHELDVVLAAGHDEAAGAVDARVLLGVS